MNNSTQIETALSTFHQLEREADEIHLRAKQAGRHNNLKMVTFWANKHLQILKKMESIRDQLEELARERL